MMPEMDGYRTIQAIREKPALRRLPIIALNGKGNEGRSRKVFGGRSSDYSPTGQHRATALGVANVAASLDAGDA